MIRQYTPCILKIRVLYKYTINTRIYQINTRIYLDRAAMADSSTTAVQPEGAAREEAAGPSSVPENSKFVSQNHFSILGRNQSNFRVVCNYFQGEPITGGATRFKKHLLAGGGVRACTGVPQDVLAELKAFVLVPVSNRGVNMTLSTRSVGTG